jgi:predicted signal transduction protein with EAL and GGDEF domain
VFRLGGDEFVLVVPECGDPRVIGEIVDAVLDRLARNFEINEHSVRAGGSAGIAIAPTDGTTVDELLANADLALYQAKSNGGRARRFFLPVHRAQVQARRALDLELTRAYSQKELEIYFQTEIRLIDGAVVGAEALLRWRHPERGILMPGAFIDTLATNASHSTSAGGSFLPSATRQLPGAGWDYRPDESASMFSRRNSRAMCF